MRKNLWNYKNIILSISGNMKFLIPRILFFIIIIFITYAQGIFYLK